MVFHASSPAMQPLGIAPDAPGQAVVNAMMTVEAGFFAGDPAYARWELQPPVFTLGAKATMARLANLPRLPLANIATQQAQFQLQPGPGCVNC